MFKNYFRSSRVGASEMNARNIVSLIQKEKIDTMLDLGCDDGKWTMTLKKFSEAKSVFGVEIVEEQALKSEAEGIVVSRTNLNDKLPFENSFFDLVHSNQVIEHLIDVDNFLSESNRILKKNGVLVVSTENLASWVNIFSLILGFQPFSLTNISLKKLGIGNPFALNKDLSDIKPSWLHIKVMAYKALIDLVEIHGFKVEKVLGAGYFPLPLFFSKIDPRHSHFMTVKARKI